MIKLFGFVFPINELLCKLKKLEYNNNLKLLDDVKEKLNAFD